MKSRVYLFVDGRYYARTSARRFGNYEEKNGGKYSQSFFDDEEIVFSPFFFLCNSCVLYFFMRFFEKIEIL